MEKPMSDEVNHLAHRMIKDGTKTVSFFEGLSEEDWGQQVYTTGSAWTVRDILAHFVSTDRAFAALLRDIIDGGPGAPRDLDIVEFNEREVPSLRDLTSTELLDAFAEARRETATIASGMSQADLDKSGYHPWFGDIDLRSMAKLVYRHNMIHVRDIRKALQNGKPVAHLEITPPSAQAS
jgi:uncharacterized protein (TIGR03083 family)